MGENGFEKNELREEMNGENSDLQNGSEEQGERRGKRPKIERAQSAAEKLDLAELKKKTIREQ